MNLNAELVVLSGCETASSIITTGDEVEGLVGAVHYGGSRFVIASLWKVEDPSTFRLFDKFYEKNGNCVENFRKALVEMIEEGFSINQWAPFQIYGI